MISDVSYYSSKGGSRLNQDIVRAVKTAECVLVIAADGMGGKAGGELASAAAAEFLENNLAGAPVSADRLYDAVLGANKAVLDCSHDKSPQTTMAVLWMDDNQALAATVGDTRIYQFRSGRIRFQSVDHTVAQMSVMMGDLSSEDIRRSNERFQLLRMLGTKDELRPDLRDLDVEAGDAFLVCTDGFWEYVEELEMLEDLSRSDNTVQWLQQMKDRVQQRQPANSDNHSAVAVMTGRR